MNHTMDIIKDIVEFYPNGYIPIKCPQKKPKLSLFFRKRQSVQKISQWYKHLKYRQKLRTLLFILYSPQLFILPTSIRQHIMGKYIYIYKFFCII